MALTPRNIRGWKFATLGDFNTANATVKAFFGIPKGVGEATQEAMSVKTSLDSLGAIDFYYCGYHPQLAEVLPDSIYFDINIEIVE